MTRIRPSFTPPSSNNPGLFAYGQEINVVTAVVAQGVWWYQPATGDVTDVDAFLWDPAEAQLATGTLLAASITQGAWNFAAFDTATPLAIADGYRYSAEASGQAAFDSADQGYPFSSPDSAITAVQGCFLSDGGYPSSTWSGQHGIDLEYSADVAPNQGSADLGLQLALAATGRADHTGTGGLQLDLALAGAGRSARAGSAGLGLTLTLAAAGRRPSRGTANLSLALALAGSAGAGATPADRLTASAPTAQLAATAPTTRHAASAGTSRLTAH